jgi:hypothetical protein
MTGLNRKRQRVNSVEEYYEKIKDSCENFTVSQIGVCLWKIDKEEENKWIAVPYNFYLYPRTLNKSFLVESSSFEFLEKNNFDFNKYFFIYFL